MMLLIKLMYIVMMMMMMMMITETHIITCYDVNNIENEIVLIDYIVFTDYIEVQKGI